MLPCIHAMYIMCAHDSVHVMSIHEHTCAHTHTHVLTHTDIDTHITVNTSISMEDMSGKIVLGH